MKWLLNWWRARRCLQGPAAAGGSADRQAAAKARERAERSLAEARSQGPEVSAVAGRLRRVRGDEFAQLMTDAMRGT